MFSSYYMHSKKCVMSKLNGLTEDVQMEYKDGVDHYEKDYCHSKYSVINMQTQFVRFVLNFK